MERTTELMLSAQKELLKQRFGAAVTTYDSHAVVQMHMAKQLLGMAKQFLTSPIERLLEIGCGTGFLTQQILQHFTVKEYLANDLTERVDERIHLLLKRYDTKGCFVAGDAEQMLLDKKQAVICGGAVIQWFTDLKRFFQRMFNALDEQGYLVLSTFGPMNFLEIRRITGLGIAYPTISEIMAQATEWFEVCDWYETTEVLHFDKPRDVLKHMKCTGVNAISAPQWTRANMMRFYEKYNELKEENGYPLTYHPYFLIFRKRLIDNN